LKSYISLSGWLIDGQATLKLTASADGCRFRALTGLGRAFAAWQNTWILESSLPPD